MTGKMFRTVWFTLLLTPIAYCYYNLPCPMTTCIALLGLTLTNCSSSTLFVFLFVYTVGREYICYPILRVPRVFPVNYFVPNCSSVGKLSLPELVSAMSFPWCCVFGYLSICMGRHIYVLLYWIPSFNHKQLCWNDALLFYGVSLGFINLYIDNYYHC